MDWPSDGLKIQLVENSRGCSSQSRFSKYRIADQDKHRNRDLRLVSFSSVTISPSSIPYFSLLPFWQNQNSTQPDKQLLALRERQKTLMRRLYASYVTVCCRCKIEMPTNINTNNHCPLISTSLPQLPRMKTPQQPHPKNPSWCSSLKLVTHAFLSLWVLNETWRWRVKDPPWATAGGVFMLGWNYYTNMLGLNNKRRRRIFVSNITNTFFGFLSLFISLALTSSPTSPSPSPKPRTQNLKLLFPVPSLNPLTPLSINKTRTSIEVCRDHRCRTAHLCFLER